MANEVGFDKVIKKDAGVHDTLSLIVATINDYGKGGFVNEVIAKLGPVTNREAFIRKLFDYYCRNVNYILDSPGIEKVYTPARTIYEGAGDCKKAATFLSSVLLAAHIPAVLKHVYYDKRNNYTHIYVIVPNPDLNKYITLDPTNNKVYDKEVSYKTGTLLDLINGKRMELHQMGNSDGDMQSNLTMGSHRLYQDFEQLANQTMGVTLHTSVVHAKAPAAHLHNILAKEKAEGKSVHHAIIKALVPGNAKLAEHIQNIPIAVQRTGFLELIKGNVDGLATHLAAVMGTKPDALNNIWSIVGGDLTHLKQMVIEGAKKPSTPSGEGMSGPEYIGGFWKKFLHAAAGVLHAVAPVANLIIPGAGAAIEGVANKAEAIALSIPVKDAQGHLQPPPPLAPDLRGSQIPFGTGPAVTHHGSFGSMAGFVFKSLLMIPLYTHNLIVTSILGTIVVCTPLLYCGYKKITKWRLQNI